MIPYFEQPSIELGPLRVAAFGVIVAASVAIGDRLFMHRVRSLRLDTDLASGLGWYALIAGFLFAHFFALIFYFPEQIARDPSSLLKIWENVSSFGGMIGGAAGAFLYVRLKKVNLSRRLRWAYFDAAAFILPFGWAVGRAACAVAHDHPGRVTRFPLAISLSSRQARNYIAREYSAGGNAPPLIPPDGGGLGFHDLGWYELLLLALIVCPLFFMLERRGVGRRRGDGFWVGLFAAIYGAMRLLLDTLRVADARYFGLTPGQYAAIAMLCGGLVILVRNLRRSDTIAGGGPLLA
ncbi:MAG TPA: prolipoprotein diacylglyceryl transferase family protein [Gemmatimonadaceae bacterium]|nr:prolipoprotein diacylglyceryl transferase family protein [Gemmatimonadaceae bacterium]